MPLFPFQTTPRSAIDPKSQLLLETMAAAYRALKSLSMEIRVRATSGGKEEIADAKLEWQRPDRLSLRINGGPVSRSIVANGSIRIETTGSRTRRRDGIRPANAVADALSNSELFIAPIVPELLTKPDAFKRLLPGNVIRLGLGSDERLDNVPVDVVVADVVAPGGSARLRFAIGKTDHLLRRLQIQSTRGETTLDLSEHYTEVFPNPTLPESVFATGVSGPTVRPAPPIPNRPSAPRKKP